jgi:hypothetical protein
MRRVIIPLKQLAKSYNLFSNKTNLDMKRISIGVILTRLNTQNVAALQLLAKFNKSLKFRDQENEYIDRIAFMRDPFDSPEEISVLENIAHGILNKPHRAMCEYSKVVNSAEFDLFCPGIELVRRKLHDLCLRTHSA